MEIFQTETLVQSCLRDPWMGSASVKLARKRRVSRLVGTVTQLAGTSTTITLLLLERLGISTTDCQTLRSSPECFQMNSFSTRPSTSIDYIEEKSNMSGCFIKPQNDLTRPFAEPISFSPSNQNSSSCPSFRLWDSSKLRHQTPQK